MLSAKKAARDWLTINNPAIEVGDAIILHHARLRATADPRGYWLTVAKMLGVQQDLMPPLQSRAQEIQWVDAFLATVVNDGKNISESAKWTLWRSVEGRDLLSYEIMGREAARHWLIQHKVQWHHVLLDPKQKAVQRILDLKQVAVRGGDDY